MSEIITKAAFASVDDVVGALVARAQAHGLQVFDVIDHSGAAREKGLTLRNTKVVIFGSPEAGTPAHAGRTSRGTRPPAQGVRSVDDH